MMAWWRRTSTPEWAFLVALYGMAVAVRLPFAGVPPYGDEGMHFFLAREGTGLPTTISDLEGGTWLHPAWLFWERPLFAVLLHPFAEQGFHAFRIGHILVSSLLPVAAWTLLRSYRSHWATAALASLVCVILPNLVVWGALAVMDELMAILLAFALAVRRLGHHVFAGTLFLLSVWAKETAFAAVLAIAALSLVHALRRGEARLMPLTLDRATTALVLPLALGLVPLAVSLATGLDGFGGHGSGYASALVDRLYLTPWFIPVLAGGLAWKTSRHLCAFALFWATGYLLSHAWLGRSVEIWYIAAPAFFVVVAVASALEQMVRGASRPWPSVLAGLAIFAAIALVLVMVVAPAGPEKGRLTHPLTGQADHSLMGALEFERGARNAPLDQALERMRLDGTRDVVTVDLYYARALMLAEGSNHARHVFVDSAVFREVLPLWSDSFASRVETNGTWLLVTRSDAAYFHAINEAYSDCLVLENVEFRLYEAWRCPGRQESLEEGFRSRHVPGGAARPTA